MDLLRAELQFAGRALATFAGFELAILDLTGNTFDFPAGDVLGPILYPELPPGAVIDFSVPTEALRRHCMQLRIAGRRHIKLKVGLSDDLNRVATVRGVFGTEHALRLDANAAWTANQAVDMLREMRAFSIASVEQPVPASDIAGMRKVREETGVPVVADESLCSLADAKSLIAAKAADVFNIRIAKCGGLLACGELVNLAIHAGLRCQLGTLVGETGVLSRAAEIFGRRFSVFEFLEGKRQYKHLLIEDVVKNSVPKVDETPSGLGLEIASEQLEKWKVSPPAVFKTIQRSVA
jgi:L-Ala-D/L-Glu epimerase